MRIVRTKAGLRDALSPPRADQLRIGFVPTMGSLHDGHLALIGAARSGTDVVVVSVFVNPTQFNDPADLASYPASEADDARLAEAAGTDIFFSPTAEEIYPPGTKTTVRVAGLTDVLCGAPEGRGADHFVGVTTVVAKLLNVVDPDVAYLGQKDAQQATVIKRMVADLDFPVRIEVVPTVREPDGVAMSSRNVRLNPADRARAPALHAALLAVERAAGSSADVEAALSAGRAVLDQAGVEPEYLEALDAGELEPVHTFNGRAVLVAIAAPIGSARLIDNVVIGPKETD
jgi:pantoate--beta-alanine ligase